MKLKTIKTEREVIAAIVAGGTSIEMTSENSNITQLRIGNLVIRSEYGSLKVMSVEEFEEATRYRVTAQVQGFEPRIEFFENYSDASEFKRSFGDGVEVTVDEDVKVLVDDDGDVVGVHADAVRPVDKDRVDTDIEMPF